MFKSLLKTRLAAFGAYYSGAARRHGGKKKKSGTGSKVLYGLLMVYCFVVFVGMFFALFSTLAGAFGGTDFAWLYFTLYALMSFALMFIGSVFMAKSQLFEAQDNELLLAMPVPPRYILGSRMVALAIYNAVFQLIVAIPALAAWCVSGYATAAGVIAFLLLLPVLNLFTLAVTCLFSWLLSLLTSRMRNKNLVTMLFSLLFFGAYFVVIGRANEYVAELAASGAKIADALGGVSPLVWLGEAMVGGNVPALLGSLALLLVPFVLVYALLSRSFIGIVTMKRGAAKKKYQERELKTASAGAALVRREAARLTSSAAYMMNAGLGVVFCAAAAAFLIFGRGRVLGIVEAMGLSTDTLTAIAALVIGYFLSTMVFSASSVSLEGKNIWIVRSAPVSSAEILMAKRRLHLLIAVPAALLPAAASASVIGVNAVFTALFAAAFALVTADIGLVENLRHPNLTWINEMQPVKQGAAVILTMLILMGMLLVPTLLYIFLLSGSDVRLVLGGCAVVFFGLDRLLVHWLRTSGVRRFEELG